MTQLIGAILVAIITTVAVDRSKKWIDRLEEKYFGKETEKKDEE